MRVCRVHALLSKFFFCEANILSSKAIDWYLVYLLAPTDSQITRYPLVRWGPLTRAGARGKSRSRSWWAHRATGGSDRISLPRA